MAEERVKYGMTNEEIASVMGDGNKEAEKFIGEFLEWKGCLDDTPKIPGFSLPPINSIRINYCDNLLIYGEDLATFCSVCCEGGLNKMDLALRAWKNGIISDKEMHTAISEKRTFDFEKLIEISDYDKKWFDTHQKSIIDGKTVGYYDDVEDWIKDKGDDYAVVFEEYDGEISAIIRAGKAAFLPPSVAECAINLLGENNNQAANDFKNVKISPNTISFRMDASNETALQKAEQIKNQFIKAFAVRSEGLKRIRYTNQGIVYLDSKDRNPHRVRIDTGNTVVFDGNNPIMADYKISLEKLKAQIGRNEYPFEYCESFTAWGMIIATDSNSVVNNIVDTKGNIPEQYKLLEESCKFLRASDTYEEIPDELAKIVISLSPEIIKKDEITIRSEKSDNANIMLLNSENMLQHSKTLERGGRI